MLHFCILPIVACSWKPILYVPESTTRAFLPFDIVNLTYFSLNLLKSVIQTETFQLLILKEWELARNIQKTHASILGASYEREGERICVLVVTLCGYEFVFPSGNFIFQFQSQSCLLTRSIICLAEKNKAKQSKWSPVAFPFCLSLSGGICAGAALLHPAPGCAAQHHLAWVSFPVSQELLGADFLGSGSRVHDVGCQSIASTSLCGALQG